MNQQVICNKVDIDTNQQVTWTWDPSLRLLTVSEGGKSHIGPNLFRVFYEGRFIDTVSLLGNWCPEARILAEPFLKLDDQEDAQVNIGKKNECLLSLSLPTLYSNKSAIRKIEESIKNALDQL